MGEVLFEEGAIEFDSIKVFDKTSPALCFFQNILPEFFSKYRSEALRAAVDIWCKIQVIIIIVQYDISTILREMMRNK